MLKYSSAFKIHLHAFCLFCVETLHSVDSVRVTLGKTNQRPN